jgi:hypothetical protein
MLTANMKSRFSKSVERLRANSLSILFGLVLLPLAAMGQAQSTATFTGTVSGTPPNVDATNFVNSGTWDIDTTYPFETADTLNYTNTGTMTGSVGWEFDLGPSSVGQREMSANFFNGNNASIESDDGIGADGDTVSYLLISATNIVNQGTLSAGSAGEMVLNGVNVSLARSKLTISGLLGQGSLNFFPTPTNFLPDVAIYDEYWGQASTNLDTSVVWNGATATSPFTSDFVSGNNFFGNVDCGATNVEIELTVTPSVADSTNIVVGTNTIAYTNTNGTTGMTNVMTNIIRQAVFVGISDPNITGQIGFTPSGNPTNLFETATVQLASPGGTVYLTDMLASSTNRGVLKNFSYVPGFDPVNPCSDPTFRPANYDFERVDDGIGSPGAGPPASNFLYDTTTFTNTFVQIDYAGYSAYVSDLIYNPSTAALTNQSGRIVIDASNLDLTDANISNGGALLTVQANNLVGNANAVVACQHLNLNLGSAVGNLDVTNLVTHSSLPGLNGYVSAWSALWTNGIVQIIPNYDTNAMMSAPITNIIQVEIHVLLVDASQLLSTVPVKVDDLILNSTNMIVSDSMTVTNTFLLNGQSFTLLGSLALSGGLQSWTYANAPSLLYFTNNGTLNIPEEAHFGDDGPTNYIEFVNNGTISAGSITIDSSDFQNMGIQNVSGGFFVTASSAKLENGSISSGQDADFFASTLKLDNSTITAGGELNFDVSNSLFDAGDSSGNVLSCENGFNLPTKPTTGDLLGTKITSTALGDAEVDHTWAGQDLGPNAAGFTNNEAVGKLVLSPQQGSSSFPPLFHFIGAGVSNALYVDYLDLTGLSTNYAEMLQIDPNIVIYYAAANLSFTPPPNANGIPQEPEEYLNGQFNGHLQWVSSFAGPNSSVDVIINGQTVAVNRALRYSKIIDSNGNGIPNYYDANPFNSALMLSGSVIQTNLPPAKEFAISWTAAANATYQVQYRTNITLGSWQPLLSYTNSTSATQPVTVWDTNVMSGQRFYRVSQP